MGCGGVSMPSDWNAADMSIHWMGATDMMPLGQDATDAMPPDWNAAGLGRNRHEDASSAAAGSRWQGDLHPRRP